MNVLRAAGDVQSDHHLVVCTMKVKRGWAPPSPTGEVREDVKVDRLKDDECKKEYEDCLKEEWVVHREREIGDVENEWMAFEDVVIRVLLECVE